MTTDVDTLTIIIDVPRGGARVAGPSPQEPSLDARVNTLQAAIRERSSVPGDRSSP